MNFLKVSSFLHLVKLFYKVLKDSELNLFASSLSFFSILALVPFFGISLAVVSFFGDIEKIAEGWILSIMKFLTVGGGETMMMQWQILAKGVKGETLGLVSYLVLVFTASRLLNFIDQSIQKIWSVEGKRKPFKKYFINLGLVFFAIPGIAFVIGLFISLAPVSRLNLPIELWIFLILFFLLFVVYKYIPNREVYSLTSLMAAFFISMILTMSPSIYLWVSSDFFNYNVVYGSLAFLPLFFIWMFILWFFFLFGVSLNVWLQQIKESSEKSKNGAPDWT